MLRAAKLKVRNSARRGHWELSLRTSAEDTHPPPPLSSMEFYRSCPLESLHFSPPVYNSLERVKNILILSQQNFLRNLSADKKNRGVFVFSSLPPVPKPPRTVSAALQAASCR